MFLGMRPRADTVYPFCRAQSRTAWTCSRPDGAGLTTRRDWRVRCDVTRVPCSTYFIQLLPQPGGVRGAEVDLEVRAVQTDPDVLDILGGAVQVVDEERSGDGGHGDQRTDLFGRPDLPCGARSGLPELRCDFRVQRRRGHAVAVDCAPQISLFDRLGFNPVAGSDPRGRRQGQLPQCAFSSVLMTGNSSRQAGHSIDGARGLTGLPGSEAVAPSRSITEFRCTGAVMAGVGIVHLAARVECESFVGGAGRHHHARAARREALGWSIHRRHHGTSRVRHGIETVMASRCHRASTR